MRVIHATGASRVIEVVDEHYCMADLKGDTYCPTNSHIRPHILQASEEAFERDVSIKGVFGYHLQTWNPSVGKGWQHVDSCYGFIGRYDAKLNNHYIVDELLASIKEER